ncbi:MAG: ATP-binding protein, partial [Massilia sp.]
FRARAVLLLPDASDRLVAPSTEGEAHAGAPDMGIAQWAYDRAQSAGLGTDTLPASPFFYLPLVAPMRTRGVLAIVPEQQRWILIPEQRKQLDAFAALAAIALERVHYIEVAQGALVSMESERLRNSLLAALSHDLRTPLTLLIGLSESLVRAKPALAPQFHDTARVLHSEALRMNALVGNLLDMARIQSGEVKLKLEWQAPEEVIGSALHICGPQLREHIVTTSVPTDMPLVRFDAVLLERVLCNLVENAAKYTPAWSRIDVSGSVHGAMALLTVADDGPGIPHGREEAIFDKFTRGERESAKPGVGLGLAICRAIVEAHGGTIHAAPSALGGAAFIVSLPLGQPPAGPDLEIDLRRNS